MNETTVRTMPALPPSSVQELRSSIATRALKIPDKYVPIADYMLRNPFEIAFNSATQVAREIGSTPQTLERVAHLLSFSTYRDLRQIFRQGLSRGTAYLK